MTIMPVAPVPVPDAGCCPAGTPAGATSAELADQFAALVAKHLGQQDAQPDLAASGTLATEPAGLPGSEPQTAADALARAGGLAGALVVLVNGSSTNSHCAPVASDDSADGTTEQVAVPEAEVSLVGAMSQSLTVLSAPSGPVADPVPGPVVDQAAGKVVVGAAPVPAPVSGPVVDQVAGRVVPVAGPVAGAPAPSAATPVPPTGPVPADGPTPGAGSDRVAVSTPPDATEQATVTPQVRPTDHAAGAGPAVSQPTGHAGGVSLEGMTPVQATSPAAETSGTASTSRVTEQVFPQVTRLVSRGDGVHRLTLRLNPEDLGEVKVILTVKGGTVDVTLSAGAAARAALHEGSPQLRALLEVAGATTGQVLVRELGAAAGTSLSNQPGTPGGAGHGQPSGHGDGAQVADGSADGGARGSAQRDGGPGDRADTTPRERGAAAPVSGTSSSGLDLNL